MSSILTEARWRARFPVGEVSEPVRGPIGPGTVFLYTETTSPLPAASMYGYWQWFDGPLELAGYLRHVGFPEMLSIWFCRQQWDPDHDSAPMGSRQILAGAREHGCLEDDIPFVAGLLDRLEAVDGDPPDLVLKGLGAVASDFTKRFGRTSTWDLVLQVAPTAEAAGAIMAERLGWDQEYGSEEWAEPFDLDRWLGLCRAADAGDSTAADLVAEELADDTF